MQANAEAAGWRGFRWGAALGGGLALAGTIPFTQQVLQGIGGVLAVVGVAQTSKWLSSPDNGYQFALRVGCVGVGFLTGWGMNKLSGRAFPKGANSPSGASGTGANGAGGAGTAPARPRLPQDINVNPTPPPVKSLNRPIGLSATQNARLQADIARLRAQGGTNFRVNQQQVNAAGQRVGTNRPDLQYTDANGKRVYIEYDTSSSTRGPAHEERILANDPEGTVILETVD